MRFELPIRPVILGPSGSGKTVLPRSMILGIYKDCFSNIFVFSPSMEVDVTWGPVKNCIGKSTKVMHTIGGAYLLRRLRPWSPSKHTGDAVRDHGFNEKRGD